MIVSYALLFSHSSVTVPDLQYVSTSQVPAFFFLWTETATCLDFPFA